MAEWTREDYHASLRQGMFLTPSLFGRLPHILFDTRLFTRAQRFVVACHELLILKTLDEDHVMGFRLRHARFALAGEDVTFGFFLVGVLFGALRVVALGLDQAFDDGIDIVRGP